MPANLGTAADPRLERGAFITNGHDLYCVLETLTEPAQLPKGAPVVTLSAENCKTGWPVELDINNVRRGCRLVKAAPAHVS